MKLPILILSLSSCALAQTQWITCCDSPSGFQFGVPPSVASQRSAPQTFSVSGNFPRDLYGPIDTRGECCWGHADSDTLKIAFPPKEGYRVKLLRLRGDLIAWPKVLEGQPPIPRGAYAGVLMGFSAWDVDHEAGPARPDTCNWCAPDVPLYLQIGLAADPVRAPFDYDLRSDGVYLDAGVLYLKLASWLNTTGYPIHIEATYTLVGTYEPIEGKH